ncbi:MAG: DUF2147 domain-containing protein [Ginsengibacter sp.]
MKPVITFAFFVAIANAALCQIKNDDILGKWIAYPKQNMIVEIFRDSNQYKGKLLWFKDSDDPSRPMATRTDDKNPDPEKRKRLLLMSEVMDGLVYNKASSKWEDGTIYDAKAGKMWDAAVTMRQDGSLEVRGFWHYRFIGKTMIFKRI